MRRVAIGLGAVLLSMLALGAGTVHAFTEPATYIAEARSGGGGGRWFTGSPAEGYGCSVCHVDAGEVVVSVEGLPPLGYVPGQRYDVRIAWPGWAAYTGAVRAQLGGPPLPMAAVAELVTETGEGSGSIEVASTAHAQPGELCVPPLSDQSAQLFWMRPGRRTEEAGTSCESTTLGQRCVAATRSCGASELRFAWTAPATAQETIWFAAGFVGSHRIANDPFGDVVNEMLIPIQPAGSAPARYETELSGGCSIGHGTASSTGAVAWVLALAFVTWVRRRRRA